MRRSHFDCIHGFKEGPLSLVSEVLERRLLGDKIRVTDDRTDEEPVVGGLLTFGSLLERSKNRFRMM